MILANKVVWITGASRGIGRSIALACAREGAQTVLVARKTAHLHETVEQIRQSDGLPPILADYDITDPAQVGSAFSRVFKEIKKLDVLVNNAGILQESLLGMVSSDQVKDTFSVNVFAAIYHMQYAARLMGRVKDGSIINISSVMGRVGGEGLTVYSASKAALIGATQSAAKELAPQGIRVNAIAPGFINTDMSSQGTPLKLAERLKSIRCGRIGTPDDVAAVALFFASPMSEYVTGQTLGIDGSMIV